MLEVKHLTYEVMENGAKRRLVDDVSFSVKDGENACDHRPQRRREVHHSEASDGN